MNNNSFTVWSDALVPLTLTQGDIDSISATITFVPTTGAEFSVTSTFETVDDKVVADLTFNAPEVTVETVFEYYVSENFTTGPSLIYPDPSNCTGGKCELPTLTICPLPEVA